MTLIAHCGAKHVDLETLANLPVPAPMGPRHAIRPFIDDVNIIRDELATLGLGIRDESYAVQYEKDDSNGMPQRYFGVLEVGDANADHGFGLMVGLRGAHDQRFARGLAVGSRVFVCDNLCFSGSIEVKTKQTTFIDQRLPWLLRDAVARVPQLAELQTERFDAYRNRELKPRWGDAALVECMRRGIINPSHMGKAMAEWDEPSHAEHAENGHSVWRLQNAVTEAIKPTNEQRIAVANAWDRTTKLTGFLDEISGFDLAA